MDAQLEIRKILQTELLRIKARNPSYSLRSFARSLTITPSALSEIMNSDRPITKKMGEKILRHLNITPDKYQKLLSALQTKNSTPPSKYVQMDMDQYYLITDWYYYAVLSLAETRAFREDSKWIAKRLNIQVREAEQALHRLERLELLTRNAKGHLIPSGVQLTTTVDIANDWIRRRHMSNLDLAKKSLEKDSVDIRDFSEITMAVNMKKMPEAKLLIKKFRRELCKLMESGDNDEVYKLCVQLFPLSEKEIS